LRIDDARIKDAHRFDEMGMDPLDLVIVVLRLEGLDPGKGEFPVAVLDGVTTVGDLVALVDLWLQRDVRRDGQEPAVARDGKALNSI
jgi:acyl carrier protein